MALIDEAQLAHAISNITSRSERVPDPKDLQKTYVETGVLPQLANFDNQVIYGRRGTGKTHVLQMLGTDREQSSGVHVVYVDVRLLGSAHLFTDLQRSPADRCVAVYKDLLAIIQGQLLDLATDPQGDGGGMEEVTHLGEFLVAKTGSVESRDIVNRSTASEKGTSAVRAAVSATGPSLEVGAGRESSVAHDQEISYTEAFRETIVFSEVSQLLDRALGALGVGNLVILIDEWTSLPVDVQPYVAEFLKRSFFPSNRVTVKIASLEYRSRFSLPAAERGNPIGFELGPDIAANLDLDDYYVYDRNPEQVVEIFLTLLHKHVTSRLPEDLVVQYGIADATSFRSKLFTERATFTELVRAGEGVVRDFLGIFKSAFFKAKSSGRRKIDLNSVEEAARDWYETDKATVLSEPQQKALHAIISDVIGTRQTKMFMLKREHADHPMIQSLFDLRLIHLISRGYSDKENPGQRYNIYALDYGTYVDLKRTKSEPDDLLELEFNDDSLSNSGAEAAQAPKAADRIVPFADKRSIRRVILNPAIFDDLERASAP